MILWRALARFLNIFLLSKKRQGIYALPLPISQNKPKDKSIGNT